MKTCSKCGLSKDGSLFSKNASAPDGLHSVCKSCRAVVAAAYRTRPDVAAKESERLKAAYQANRSTLKVRRVERYERTKEQTLEKNRQWRAANIEKHRALCRAWARNNPGAMTAIVAKRRARMRSANGSFTKSEIDAIYSAQAGLCVYCKCDLSTGFHRDHINPISRGGSNDASNIQLTCPDCNRRKSDKLPSELPHEFWRAAP